MLARRALQEAMDRRDNGGPPPELLHPRVPAETVESPGSPEPAGSPGLSARVPEQEAGHTRPATVLADAELADAAADESSAAGAGPAEGGVEYRLGVPFPRVAA